MPKLRVAVTDRTAARAAYFLIDLEHVKESMVEIKGLYEREKKRMLKLRNAGVERASGCAPKGRTWRARIKIFRPLR